MTLIKIFGRRSTTYKDYFSSCVCSDNERFDRLHQYMSLIIYSLVSAVFRMEPETFFTVLPPVGDQNPFNLDPEMAIRIKKEVQVLLKTNGFITSFWQGFDRFGLLYENLLSKKERMIRGEFYTPRLLSDFIFLRTLSRWQQDHCQQDHCQQDHCQQDHSQGEGMPSILDPGCGSGAFLLSALEYGLACRIPREQLFSQLVGIDLNPLAVLMTRANFLLDYFRDTDWKSDFPLFMSAVEEKDPFSIYLSDSILGHNDRGVSLPLKNESFDLILGNPPWINWDHLSSSYREATKPLWEQYGLFSLSGSDALYGGGKKELASLMLYVSADRYLKVDGLLSMLIPLSLFRTSHSGEGFRKFRLDSLNMNLGLLEINDFSNGTYFGSIQSKVGNVCLKKGAKTVFPIPFHEWAGSPLKLNRTRFMSPWSENESGSVFQIVEKGNSRPSNIKKSDYKAQLGANTAGANGVYWLEPLEEIIPEKKMIRVRNLISGGKRKLPQYEVVLESSLIYPLLRWRDVDCFQADPSAMILILQDPETRRGISEEELLCHYPNIYDYICRFKEELMDRAAWKKFQARAFFWSMYNINANTLSPYKVVWRRMDSRMRAAVLTPDNIRGMPIIPQETLAMVAVESKEEAYYLAGILNSREMNETVLSISNPGTKSFGAPGILQKLGIKKFDPTDSNHRRYVDDAKKYQGGRSFQ